MNRVESCLAQAIAQLHFTVKASRKFERPDLEARLQKQYDELVSVAQEISSMLDEMAASENEQPFQVGDFVQVSKLYNPYCGYIGKVIELNPKKGTCEVFFSGMGKRTFLYDCLTKGWTIPTPRLTMKA